MTIINIRGTSGSGKSTLARNLMGLYQPHPIRYREEGRKQPLGYRYRHPDRAHYPDLAVVGHYETDCGGADTIPDYNKLIRNVKTASLAGMDVLFEGLLFSGDVKHTIALHEWCKNLEEELVVIAMLVPIDVCLESVNLRRKNKADRVAAQKGIDPVYKGEVNPKNTIAKHKGLELACKRLQDAGVTVHRAGRESAFNLCRQLLRLP